MWGKKIDLGGTQTRSGKPFTGTNGWVAPLLLLALPVLSLSVYAGTLRPSRADSATKTVAGKPGPLPSFNDLSGHPHTAADLARNKASVFLFIGTECPISNGYTPRLLNLAKVFSPRGVRTFAVYANRNETREQVEKHAKSRGLTFPVVKDETGTLGRALGATVTPEAVVVDSSGTVRYRGRIDDSQQREKVTRSDLRDALTALLAGKAVPQPRTKAFGCAIAYAHPDTKSRLTALAPVTYAKDVAPILRQNCQTCHRAGEVGPMSLESYEQASAFAGVIKQVTQKKTMPPWHAAEGYGDFLDPRRLTDAQIATLAKWADAGAPLGDKKMIPPPTAYPKGWQLGEPDVVYSSPEPFHVAADGADVYRNFVIDPGFDGEKYVTAIEVRPDQKQIVHHVIAYVDARPNGKGRSLELDAKDPGPGYTSSGGGINFGPDGMLGGWAPGNEPRFMPDGIAIKLPKGARIVLQIHYHKNGVAADDQTRVGVHFAKGPVRKLAMPYPILNAGMEVPAGAKDYKVTAETTAPADVHAIAIMPHMHRLGQRMKVTATEPDGTTVPLVYVPNWDFNWQATYAYKEPVALPRGTKVRVEAWYDNSADNPNNPNSPPKPVRWGEQTTDEMCLAYVWVTVDAEHLDIHPPKTAL